MSDHDDAEKINLRRRAEEQVQQRIASLPHLSPEQVAELLNELEAHRIEIQMQCEELRANQQLLEQSRDSYADLYDFSPLGYVTLDSTGSIKEINLTAATLLEAERSCLPGKRFSIFIVPEDQHLLTSHFTRCRKSIESVTTELRLRGKKGRITPVELCSTTTADSERRQSYRTAITDITERKLATEALRESERRFRALTQMSHAGVYFADAQGKCLYVNPRWCEMAGLTPEEALGDGWVQGLHPEDRATVTANWNRMTTSGGHWGLEYRFQTPGGRTTWVWGVAAPISDEHGKTLGYVGTNLDITQRRRVEEARQESESRYRSLFENMLDGFAYCQMLFDEQGHPVDFVYLAVNNSFGRLTGLKDVTGKRVTEVIPRIKELNPELFEIYGRVAVSGIPERFEIDFTPLNSYLSVSVYSPAKGYFVAVFDNITARKHAEESLRLSEERLRQSNERLELAQRAAGEGVWDWNTSTGHIEWSPEMFTMFGLDAETATASFDTWKKILHPDDRLVAGERIEEALRDHTILNSEYRILHPDGQTRWISALGKGIHDGAGHSVRMVGVCVDITERKRTEEHIKVLNATLEQRVAQQTAEAHRRANQLQRLAAQMAQAEERERRRLSQVLHDHLQQVLVAARLRLGRTVGKVQDELTAAAITEAMGLVDEAIGESRSLTKELSPPVLYDGGLAAGLEWLGRETEKKYQLPVIVEVAPEAEPDDLTTKVFVFQGARELILNAMKHANASSLKICLSIATDDRLQVIVEDDGTGFDPEMIKSESRAGFGLFSIRERIDVIGGELTITSSPIEGTKATIIAPCRRARASEPPPGTPRHYSWVPLDLAAGRSTKVRVLLADDHPVLRKGLADMLMEHPDFNVIGEAKDGQEALEMALQLRPDVILMDISMPRVDGIEATRQIKQVVPEVGVIGLSMHESDDVASAMKIAGASDYLTKTAPVEDLVSAILRVCPRR